MEMTNTITLHGNEMSSKIVFENLPTEETSSFEGTGNLEEDYLICQARDMIHSSEKKILAKISVTPVVEVAEVVQNEIIVSKTFYF